MHSLNENSAPGARISTRITPSVITIVTSNPWNRTPSRATKSNRTRARPIACVEQDWSAARRPHGAENYSHYFPVAFSSLLLNVPSGNLSMSNIALSAGV